MLVWLLIREFEFRCIASWGAGRHKPLTGFEARFIAGRGH